MRNGSNKRTSNCASNCGPSDNTQTTLTVFLFNWVIVTICKHIISNHTLPSGNIHISIEESTYGRIIIPALQIIEPRLLVVHITAIPQRIQLSKLAGRCKDLAPDIVIVVCALHAVGGFEAYYIALQVGDVVVDSPVVDQRERCAAGVSNEAAEWSHSEHLRQRPA